MRAWQNEYELSWSIIYATVIWLRIDNHFWGQLGLEYEIKKFVYEAEEHLDKEDWTWDKDLYEESENYILRI